MTFKKIFTPKECVDEIQKEIRFRYSVYAKKVRERKMTEAEKKRKIAIMEYMETFFKSLNQVTLFDSNPGEFKFSTFLKQNGFEDLGIDEFGNWVFRNESIQEEIHVSQIYHGWVWNKYLINDEGVPDYMLLEHIPIPKDRLLAQILLSINLENCQLNENGTNYRSERKHRLSSSENKDTIQSQ